MIKYIVIFLFSVFISSISQILLKISTYDQYDSIIKEYLNPKVIVSYGIFFCSSFLTIYAYKYVPLSMGPILESSGYIYVSILSYLCLKESIGKYKIMGMICILIGIIISSI